MLENGININQHVEISKGYFSNIEIVGRSRVLNNGALLTERKKKSSFFLRQLEPDMIVSHGQNEEPLRARD